MIKGWCLPRRQKAEKLQQYSDEEKSLWEDFRHGMSIGIKQFPTHF